MSWWVGKDRETFGEALKEHTDRIMRQGQRKRGQAAPAAPTRPTADVVTVAPEPVVAAPVLATCARCGKQFEPAVGVSGRFCGRACYEQPKPLPPSLEPSHHHEVMRQQRARYVADGKCAWCGRARDLYAYRCNDCQAKCRASKQQSRGSGAWKPGSRGPAPKGIRPVMLMARGFKDAIGKHPEALSHRAMGRAAVVMVIGFLFRQRLDWIQSFTGYPAKEIKDVADRLRASGTWNENGTIACEWGDSFFTDARVSKQKQFEHDLAFWLDALAATGEIRRETRDGQFFYMAV